jgi:hypothetical protein
MGLGNQLPKMGKPVYLIGTDFLFLLGKIDSASIVGKKYA